MKKILKHTIKNNLCHIIYKFLFQDNYLLQTYKLQYQSESHPLFSAPLVIEVVSS